MIVSSYFTLTCVCIRFSSPPTVDNQGLPNLSQSNAFMECNSKCSPHPASLPSEHLAGCILMRAWLPEQDCHTKMCTRDLAIEGRGCFSMWLAESACWPRKHPLVLQPYSLKGDLTCLFSGAFCEPLLRNPLPFPCCVASHCLSQFC